MLQVKNLTVRYGPLTLVNGASFTLKENQWLMVIGPNGAGKSTLVNALTGGAPFTGQICLHGKDTARLSPGELARNIGMLAQTHQVGYSFTVEELVHLGRYAWRKGLFGGPDKNDNTHVEEALAATGMLTLRRQSLLTLSGGELQRAFLAQVIAQSPQIMVLDEPANHLDLIYQKQIFAMVQHWAMQPGHAVISVVHNLSLAKKYGTHALLMDKSNIVSAGKANEVITPQNLNNVYQMDVAEWMLQMLEQWQTQ